MSVIAGSLRRQRLPLLTFLALVLAAAGAWILLSSVESDRVTQPSAPVAAPAVEQAPWKVEYSAEARFGKLSKAQRERYSTQKEKVATLVTGIYDAIFLEPQRLDEVLRRSFSRDAAGSLAARQLSFPNGATEVKATRRRAHIALDAQTADVAVGRVTVRASAALAERSVAVEHRSTLWLERAEGDWKVIAFDVEHGPAR